MPQVRARQRHQVAATALVVSAGLLLAACTQASARSDKTGASSAAPVSPAASVAAASSAQALASSASAAALAAGVSGATGASPGVGSAPPPVLSGIDPLTGLPPTSPAAEKRPALAVKVDNVQGAWPQAGLNQADIVYDLPVEGGLTRLLAIFHSADVPVIGPIRSARPVDADILHLLGHSYFAFSGGTSSDLSPINDHSNATPMWWDVTPSLFVIRHDHAVPHQVFGTTAMLYAGGEARSPSTTPPPPMFSYQVAVPTNAVPASTVTAQYSAATAAWTWNGTQYLRNQSGHADLLIDGSQVTATNVVVMSVSVRNTSAHDSHGTVVPLPVVIGSGQVWVFRNGVVIHGTWSRPNENSPLKLQTTAGQVIPLMPGRTWVEVLPNSSLPRIN
ncbi:MAG TPA: DUF3048 domain-containing protein [Acidothermaceae bacterium]|nr:DUF3048 domain-containing protein [Acidothermaceae bacterium]